MSGDHNMNQTDSGWRKRQIALSMTLETKPAVYYSSKVFTQFDIDEAIEAEREACAKVCDELHWPWHMGDNSGPKECATAIRARGQA